MSLANYFLIYSYASLLRRHLAFPCVSGLRTSDLGGTNESNAATYVGRGSYDNKEGSRKGENTWINASSLPSSFPFVCRLALLPRGLELGGGIHHMLIRHLANLTFPGFKIQSYYLAFQDVFVWY